MGSLRERRPLGISPITDGGVGDHGGRRPRHRSKWSVCVALRPRDRRETAWVITTTPPTGAVNRNRVRRSPRQPPARLKAIVSKKWSRTPVLGPSAGTGVERPLPRESPADAFRRSLRASATASDGSQTRPLRFFCSVPYFFLRSDKAWLCGRKSYRRPWASTDFRHPDTLPLRSSRSLHLGRSFSPNLSR